MRLLLPVVLLAGGGCDRIFNLELVEGSGSGSADAAQGDAMVDVMEVPKFSVPMKDVLLSSTLTDDDPTLTDDMLEIYFNSYRTGGSGMGDIWYSSRPSLTIAWATPIPVTILNSSALDNTPRISADGHTMYMSREPVSTRQIYISTRPARSAQAWSTLTPVSELNSQFDDSDAVVTDDGLTVYFTSNRGDSSDIYFATRTDSAGTWGLAAPVPGVNTDSDEDSPFTHDGKTLYFSSNRPTTRGMTNIWRAKRASVGDPFSAVEPVEELNTDFREEDPWVSPDGNTIWYASSRDGDIFDIYTATR